MRKLPTHLLKVFPNALWEWKKCRQNIIPKEIYMKLNNKKPDYQHAARFTTSKYCKYQYKTALSHLTGVSQWIWSFFSYKLKTKTQKKTGKTRWSPRTRMLTRMLMVQMSKHMVMQSRTIPFCNSLFEQSCTCFRCYQSAVWSGKCRVWVWSVK